MIESCNLFREKLQFLTSTVKATGYYSWFNVGGDGEDDSNGYDNDDGE